MFESNIIVIKAEMAKSLAEIHKSILFDLNNLENKILMNLNERIAQRCSTGNFEFLGYIYNEIFPSTSSHLNDSFRKEIIPIINKAVDKLKSLGYICELKDLDKSYASIKINW